MKTLSGFTLLELLIVILVMGLLGTMAILSIRTARMRMRDAQRIADMSVLNNGLSQYWLTKATYPVSAGVNLGAPGTNTDALTGDGFVAAADAKAPIWVTVPKDPTTGVYYRYHGGSNGYSIRFQTESDTIYGKANVYFEHSNGIDQQDVEK